MSIHYPQVTKTKQEYVTHNMCETSTIRPSLSQRVGLYT